MQGKLEKDHDTVQCFPKDTLQTLQFLESLIVVPPRNDSVVKQLWETCLKQRPVHSVYLDSSENC